MAASQLSALRATHEERMRALGVREEELAGLILPDLPPPADDCIRVLQWNVLADGLSDDGFLVKDVLVEPPKDATSPEVLMERLSDAVKQRKAGSSDAVEQLKVEFGNERAQRNHDAVLDWQRRWASMRALVAAIQPDVITLQELDRMDVAVPSLKEIGYSCQLDADATFVPMHLALKPAADADATLAYLVALERCGFAFAPKFPSSCRKLALKRGLASAADDGVAVFWNSARMRCTRLDFLALPDDKGSTGTVRASLVRKGDGARLAVICAHLKSGDGAEFEQTRLQQINQPGKTIWDAVPFWLPSWLPAWAQASVHAALLALARPAEARLHSTSLLAWIEESQRNGVAALVCLDSNSSPNRAEPQTVWRALSGAKGMRSVWEQWFDKEGAARNGELPMSTNKMRGPVSAQAKKASASRRRKKKMEEGRRRTEKEGEGRRRKKKPPREAPGS